MTAYDELNEPQRLAVLSIHGPLLIIAGAGSGKTRVITYRMAHMLKEGIPQQSILALTFTNKAAREMEERIRALTRRKLTNLTVSTFHAFGVKVLRRTIHRLGWRENFSIYDQSDQTALIKETARETRVATESLELSKLVNLFSAIKTGRRIWDAENEAWRQLYQDYQAHLRVYNAVDFDDLIMLPIRIFQEFPDLLAEYRERFRYILVDEFQDTSKNQYDLMKLLADGSRNICAVGDDDQSIYSWRGANFENIVNFEKDYPELKEIKLEQNYRSTPTILAAANKVIERNKNRKTKALWTGAVEGRPIELAFPADEDGEGAFIAEKIKSLAFREAVKYHDIGILVRTNSLTRSLEEALLAANIPYKVSGGESFFQRKEIKDIVSYLRVMANPDDDVSLLRIVNTPRRGIGRRTLEEVTAQARHRACSLYSAAQAHVHAADSGLGEKARTDLAGLLELIDEYRTKFLTGKRKLAATLRALVAELDYWGWLVLENQKNEKAARWKFKNIELFANSLENWERDPDNADPSIFSYLNRISLITRDDEDEDERGKVNLMTIHSAKGLEFDIVFLAGVEAGIIPHARSMEESADNLEEERRLFYVAITRARRKLYMSSCRSRRVMRETVECVPSPFLDEIPAELIAPAEEDAQLTTDEAGDAFAALKARFGA